MHNHQTLYRLLLMLSGVGAVFALLAMFTLLLFPLCAIITILCYVVGAVIVLFVIPRKSSLSRCVPSTWPSGRPPS